MPNERPLRVRWQLPCARADVAKKSGDDDYGMYQIYGHHVVFGPGALLYIGIAVDRPFAARFSEHASWLDSESDVLVRLGRIEREEYKDDAEWENLLRDLEALTIYWHSPPYNSKNIVSYNRNPLRVQNWGDRGRLLPEYSSHWQPARPTDP